MPLQLIVLWLSLASTIPSSHSELNLAAADDSVHLNPSRPQSILDPSGWSRDVTQLQRFPRTIRDSTHVAQVIDEPRSTTSYGIRSSSVSDEASSSSAASSSAASGASAASSAASGDTASSSSASGGAVWSSASSGQGTFLKAGPGDLFSSLAGSTSNATSGHVSSSAVSEAPAVCVNCTCVPYHLCADGELLTGPKLLDETSCPNFLDKLCQFPSKEPIPEIMARYTDKENVPTCGHRNPMGLGVRLDGFKDGEAQVGEFPWMTIVLEREHLVLDLVVQRFVCGGSLVHNQVVMTAAHCVSGKDPTKLIVRLGDWDTQNDKEIFAHEEHQVAHVKRHERFHGINLRYDVALLFLEKPVELKHHINTLCLPEEDENFDYASCVATGFGKDQFHGGRFQNIMKQVDLSVVPRRACQTKLRGTRLGAWFRLHRTFTCAGGEGGVDTCRGDGGSPLACPSKEDPNKYVQAGIVAWGIGCGEEGVPGVYASVPKLVKWVNEKIAEYFEGARPSPGQNRLFGMAPPV